MEKSKLYELAEQTKKIVKGEGENDVQVNIRIAKNPLIKLPQNIMVFQTFAMLAAIKLKPSSNQVLMLLFGLSAYENYIGIDVKTICEHLGGISERSVLRGLKELEDEKIIIKFPHPSDKRRKDYFINPLAAWKGNSYARAKRLKALTQNKQQLALFSSE